MMREPAALVSEVAMRLRTQSSSITLDGDAVPTDPDEEASLIVAAALARQPDSPRAAAIELVARREAGELLGHLVGQVRFLGCDLGTATDCVVPRKETEILGRAAIAALRHAGAESSSRPLRAVDMCCGAGNLACAIAYHVPDAHIWAADLTDGCCRLAKRNVSRLGLEERVSVLQGDLFGALEGQSIDGLVDLVCCNPPYISSARLETDRATLLAREPREAFDGGPYGLSIHQRVLSDAKAFLRPSGWLMFEIGVGQERQIELLLKRTRGAYSAIRWENDTLGRPRVAAVQRVEQGT